MATNADSLPTGTLYVNGTADAASVTVTNVATGIYKAAVTLPTLAVGDVVDLRIAATVSSVADTEVIWSDTKDLVIDSAGLTDANVVKVGPSGSGTTQTARDIGASVLLSSGTGTGQLDFTSGVVKANATQILGGTIPTPNTTGVPLVDTKYVGGTLQTARDIGASVLLSSGTGTGQLDITSGVVKANATQFAGQTITAAAGVTIPSTIASPTNITGGTINTATNLTNLPSIPAGWLTASGIAASALNGKGDWNTTAPDNTTIGTIATNIGTNGSGLTAIGDTRLNNLDAAVSTRLATAGYTAPDNASASSAASSAATAATQATNAASQTTAANIRTAVGLAAANLDSQLGAIPTTFRLKKNTAFSGFSLVMFNTSGVAATGKTVSGSVSIDGGAFGTLTNSVSEIGSGAYKVNLAAADTNGNDLLFLFTATDCKPLFLKVITQP